VLQLAVDVKRTVQPHYLIDLGRRSTLQEVAAMYRVRRDLSRLDSEAAARIEPTTFAVAREVPTDPSTIEKLAQLRERGHVVRQYDYITAYAARAGGLGLEVGIMRDDYRTVALLDGNVEYVEEGGGYWQLDRNRVPADDGLMAFAPIRFPLLSLSKLDMLAKAEVMGVRDLMYNTWVCRNPQGSKRDRACGRCSPCRDSMQQGMRHRLGLASQVRYHLRGLYALARPLRVRYEARTRSAR